MTSSYVAGPSMGRSGQHTPQYSCWIHCQVANGHCTTCSYYCRMHNFWSWLCVYLNHIYVLLFPHQLTSRSSSLCIYLQPAIISRSPWVAKTEGPPSRPLSSPHAPPIQVLLPMYTPSLYLCFQPPTTPNSLYLTSIHFLTVFSLSIHYMCPNRCNTFLFICPTTSSPLMQHTVF